MASDPNRRMGRGPISVAEAERIQASSLQRGELTRYEYHDPAGRKITEFFGDPMAWMSRFQPPVRLRQPPQWHTAAPRRNYR